MFDIPNSGAMDAAAGGRGPGTVALPTIVGGNPQAILAHAAALTARVARLVTLLADLERAREQLREVWSAGSASDSVVQKLNKSFASFQQIIETVYAGVRELEGAAAQLTTAQSAYRAVVGAVNPTVAALMSNPYTQAAGRALAVSTTGILKAFLTGIGGILTAIGVTNLGQILTGLATIVGQVEQLFSKNNDGGAAPAPALPAGSAGNPVLAPPPMASVATGAGQAVLGGGYGGYGMPSFTGAGYPAGGSMSSYVPSALGTDQWVAVQPGQSTLPSGGTPVTMTPTGPVQTLPIPPAASGGESPPSAPSGPTDDGDDDVTITASKGDMTLTVEVPVDTGRAFDIEVSASSGGQTVNADISVGADGSVKVD
ncbi:MULTISPECIES: WXG100 family type VII secretion target [unclassified Micromonospora]|uniref:WXG100 family type VII secretion target n=1 Tax=unclassified Micromonospora TaxID=2617518 RepID=UPI0033260259